MNKQQRSIAAKKAWKKKQLALKDKPEITNTQPAQSINTGNHKSSFIQNSDAAFEGLVYHLHITTKEEVKQDIEMAIHHHRVMMRYVQKAFRE